MNGLIITLDHVYSVPNLNGRAGFCGRGARAWCARHGIEWRTLVHEGIPAETLIATGDALALRVVEHARAQQHGR